MTRALALKATVATGLCPPVADGFVDRCVLAMTLVEGQSLAGQRAFDAKTPRFTVCLRPYSYSGISPVLLLVLDPNVSRTISSRSTSTTSLSTSTNGVKLVSNAWLSRVFCTQVAATWRCPARLCPSSPGSSLKSSERKGGQESIVRSTRRAVPAIDS